MTSQEARIVLFWAKVNKTDSCWLWTASKDAMGYGMFGVRPSRCERAHRFSWRVANGEIPDDMCVLHRCDTPSCVNPDHLFLGTRDDNMRDRQSKQRHAHGSRSGRARLSESQVLEARALRAAGTKIAPLAQRFGVSDPTMSAAVGGRTWRHI